MTDSSPFIHPTALVATQAIGKGTRIWAFVNIQDGVAIGSDCNICDQCFIEQGVTIGSRVTVKNGVALWDGVRIEDDVFIGPHAVFTNDVFPRSRQPLERPVITLVRHGASLGANCVIVAGHTIGQFAMIGAGAVVTCDVPDHTLWYGNPARMHGYVCECGHKLDFPEHLPPDEVSNALCECGQHWMLDGGIHKTR